MRVICKYIGGKVVGNGNWIRDSMRRDVDYETETGRDRQRESERKFSENKLGLGDYR